jgi:diguanylate cyclase (GGDEF)-like protein
MVDRLVSSVAALIVERAPLGVLVLGDKGQILSVNKALEDLLGLAAKRLVGHANTPAIDLTPEERTCLFVPPVEPQRNLLLPATDARPARWLKCWREALGEAHWQVHFYSDITEQQQLKRDCERLAEELALHAVRDPTTALPNRRALLQGLDPHVSRSRRYENPLSVVLLKIVDLQQLDIEHGAGSGEQAVIALSQVLKDQLRWVDMAGRMDADEFLVILPETPEPAALDLTSKLRARIAALQVAGSDGHAMALKVSCNAVGWSKGDDVNKLLRRAYEGL